MRLGVLAEEPRCGPILQAVDYRPGLYRAGAAMMGRFRWQKTSQRIAFARRLFKDVDLWLNAANRRVSKRRSTSMSLKIEETCVNCDVCEPICPNQAITLGEWIYQIDAARCTECVGHFNTPQCVAVCPVDCIVVDPRCVETHQQLEAKSRALQREDAAQPLRYTTGGSH